MSKKTLHDVLFGFIVLDMILSLGAMVALSTGSL